MDRAIILSPAESATIFFLGLSHVGQGSGYCVAITISIHIYIYIHEVITWLIQGMVLNEPIFANKVRFKNSLQWPIVNMKKLASKRFNINELN